MNKCINLLLVCTVLLLGAQTVVADWNIGDPNKWVQLPDETPAGIDIRVDRNDGIQRTLADDFECTETGPITDVHLWGSWNQDEKGQITKIHLSIHSDIPDPDGTGPEYSMPGQLLWQGDFLPGQFTERHWKDIAPDYEWWWDVYSQYNPPMNPNQQGDQNIWQYNIYIEEEPFIQQGTTDNPIVYWLDVYVETDGQGEFGWKTARDHWNDDAVYFSDGWQELRYPLVHPYEQQSIDMAFVITGKEEPCEPPEPNLAGYVKWEQLPDTSPNGIDIRCDRSDGIPRILADDFECNTPGPITDVHIWGSWNEDLKGQIQKIHLSIHSDIPDPDGSGPLYSMPDDPPLWEMDFSPADFNETLYFDISPAYEWWWDTYTPYLNSQGDHQIWQYDIFIDPDVAFVQQGTVENPIVYWLDVYVELEPEPAGAQFGWKTAKTHWNDDAVWGEDTGGGPPTWMELRYPSMHPQEPNSVDMAFAITTLDCFPTTDPNYPTWVSVGRPYCWCYPRQCHGDTDNIATGDAKMGYTYVNAIDLTLFMSAWGVVEPPQGPGITYPELCADIDHKTTGDAKMGYTRVSAPDLTLFMASWGVVEPPVGPGVPPDCP